jgi:hypothetical protein
MMKNTGRLLSRMLRVASETPPMPSAEESPFGFAHRVAAQWAAQPRSSSSLVWWERLSALAAVALAVAAVIVGVALWLGATPSADDAATVERQLNQLVFKL